MRTFPESDILAPAHAASHRCYARGCRLPECRLAHRIYMRAYRRGAGPKRPSAEERFWKFVNKDGPVPASNPDLGRCWIWSAGKDSKGLYARFSYAGGQIAHRFAYEHFVGPIPTGFELDHLCEEHGCVNPAHLQPLSHAAHMKRHELRQKDRATPSPGRATTNRRYLRSLARERAKTRLSKLYPGVFARLLAEETS